MNGISTIWRLNTIEPQIEHLSGVASAQVTGGRIREIHVTWIVIGFRRCNYRSLRFWTQ